MSRLQRFASTQNWPSDAGNRPAHRQKKWHDLFHQVCMDTTHALSQNLYVNKWQVILTINVTRSQWRWDPYAALFKDTTSEIGTVQITASGTTWNHKLRGGKGSRQPGNRVNTLGRQQPIRVGKRSR